MIVDQILEYLTIAAVNVRALELQESLAIDQNWRAIYGSAFVGKPRLRIGVKAEAEYAQNECSHYWVVPFNSDLAGTPVHVNERNRRGFECRGRLLSLSAFHLIEFFVCPIDFEWTMVHTHEDHSLGGPYFVRWQWIP